MLEAVDNVSLSRRTVLEIVPIFKSSRNSPKFSDFLIVVSITSHCTILDF